MFDLSHICYYISEFNELKRCLTSRNDYMYVSGTILEHIEHLCHREPTV
jgi:hypothetical protein